MLTSKVRDPDRLAPRRRTLIPEDREDRALRQAPLAAGWSSRRWGMTRQGGDENLIHGIGVCRGMSACRGRLGLWSTHTCLWRFPGPLAGSLCKPPFAELIEQRALRHKRSLPDICRQSRSSGAEGPHSKTGIGRYRPATDGRDIALLRGTSRSAKRGPPTKPRLGHEHWCHEAQPFASRVPYCLVVDEWKNLVLEVVHHAYPDEGHR